MKKLAKKEYWDSVYKDMEVFDREHKLKSWVKNQTRDYSNFLFWDVLFPKYLPRKDGLKIIEIGCAPGKYLISFKNKFNYEPYGVEYSDKGVQIARENFEKVGINPEQIIEADFFDQNFQKENQEKFDLVFSRGFIEHFEDVQNVVSGHLNLVKKGGYIIVSIPNLFGINKILAKLFNMDSYRLHNTSIMNKDDFKKLFSESKIETLFCNYVGFFSFGLFNTNLKWKYYLHRILLLVQRPFDFFARIFLKTGKFKYKYTSPYLLFIGRKK